MTERKQAADNNILEGIGGDTIRSDGKEMFDSAPTSVYTSLLNWKRELADAWTERKKAADDNIFEGICGDTIHSDKEGNVRFSARHHVHIPAAWVQHPDVHIEFDTRQTIHSKQTDLCVGFKEEPGTCEPVLIFSSKLEARAAADALNAHVQDQRKHLPPNDPTPPTKAKTDPTTQSKETTSHDDASMDGGWWAM